MIRTVRLMLDRTIISPPRPCDTALDAKWVAEDALRAAVDAGVVPTDKLRAYITRPDGVVLIVYAFIDGCVWEHRTTTCAGPCVSDATAITDSATADTMTPDELDELNRRTNYGAY